MNLDPHALEELLIWQASDFARKKHYVEAEAILDLFESSEGKHKSAAYELLARIKARQNKYAEAKAFFQKAIALDPGNPDLRRALDILPKYQRKRRTFRRLKIAVALSFFMISVGGVFWIVDARRAAFMVQETKVVSPSVNAEAKNVEKTPETKLPGGNVEWPVINISGANVTYSSSEMRIVFDQGVFIERCELSSDGRLLLEGVAEKIKQSKEPLFVIIEGHADNLPVFSGSPYKDNQYLGLSRAETILDLYHSEHGLPKSMLVAVSAGDKTPLYSNGSDETRRKNRSVSLRILSIRSSVNK